MAAVVRPGQPRCGRSPSMAPAICECTRPFCSGARIYGRHELIGIHDNVDTPTCGWTTQPAAALRDVRNSAAGETRRRFSRRDEFDRLHGTVSALKSRGLLQDEFTTGVHPTRVACSIPQQRPSDAITWTPWR